MGFQQQPWFSQPPWSMPTQPQSRAEAVCAGQAAGFVGAGVGTGFGVGAGGVGGGVGGVGVGAPAASTCRSAQFTQICGLPSQSQRQESM